MATKEKGRPSTQLGAIPITAREDKIEDTSSFVKYSFFGIYKIWFSQKV